MKHFLVPSDPSHILHRRSEYLTSRTRTVRHAAWARPTPLHRIARLAGSVAAFCFFMITAVASAENVSPTVLSNVVGEQGEDFAALNSHDSAMTLFISKTGSSLGLKDMSGILVAKGLSAQMTKELELNDLPQSIHELMATLTAWQLAESVYRISSSSSTKPIPSIPSSGQQEWITSTSRLPGLQNFFRLLSEQPSFSSSPASSHTPSPELLLAAHQLALDAQRRALDSWWSLSNWKNRVRHTRGLARLCGTWQWTLHNHQNHMEQKMAMLFPPPGVVGADIPLPAETVILGDSIYLRWERNGYVQEDSLLFVKDGHKKGGQKDTLRIEGSFVNNTGGWGSIVGKRTADCQS